MKLTRWLKKKLSDLSIDQSLVIIGFLLSLFTVLWGMYQYKDTKEKEYQKVFFDERFRIYTEVSETIAKIATLPLHSEDRNQAIQKYWQLVFGKLNLVIDSETQEAIHKTSKWIVSCVEPKEPADKSLCNAVAGNGYALWFAGAARNSIIETWQVPLNQLDEKNVYSKRRAD